jgi:uncharacterized protein (TIGR00288 family)
MGRSPQPTPIPQPQPPAFTHAPNAALLIDFDNVTMGIRSELATELKSLLSSDVIKGKIAIRRAYADWRRYPQYVLPLTETSIDLIYAPAYGSARKNATDIRLAIDAMELVFTRPEIGTIVLLSGDSDFSSLVIKLKEYGKYIIGVGIRESSSDLLVQNCDEYYSYNALAGLVKSGDETVTHWDPWELSSEAVARMKRNGDVMRADRLKQVMQEIDSNFDEGNLGMSKFSRFVSEAAQRGLLMIRKLDNGQLEVDLPAPASASATSEGTAATTARAAPEKARSTSEPRTEEPRRDRADAGDDGRGDHRRRGRGGRDRERRPDLRPGRTDAVPVPADGEPTTGESVTAPTTIAAAATPSTPAPTEQGGQRLTRSEAFDLLRRAVEVLIGGDDRTVLASVVRAKARELLGRDSESLSERHFNRVLQDAHDADIVDLRRRGDDFEVARALPIATVAEQLGTVAAAQAAAKAASSQPSSAAAANKSRAGRAAFGKKLGEMPPGLLSIGMVDYGPPSQPAAATGQSPAQGAPATGTSAATDVQGEAPPRTRGGRVRKTVAAADGLGDAPAAPKKAARKRTKRAASAASDASGATNRAGSGARGKRKTPTVDNEET